MTPKHTPDATGTAADGSPRWPASPAAAGRPGAPGDPWPPEMPRTPWSPSPRAPGVPDQASPVRVWLDPDDWQGQLNARLLERRIVMASGSLDEEAATRLSAQLLTLDAEGDGPIRLELQNLRADLAAALAVMGVLDVVRVPVLAQAGGEIRGPALGVLAACPRRLAYPNAVFAFAEPRLGIGGTASAMTERQRQAERMLDSLYYRIAEAAGAGCQRRAGGLPARPDAHGRRGDRLRPHPGAPRPALSIPAATGVPQRRPFLQRAGASITAAFRLAPTHNRRGCLMPLRAGTGSGGPFPVLLGALPSTSRAPISPSGITGDCGRCRRARAPYPRVARAGGNGGHLSRILT